ncbi:MAG: hypothetical protein U9O87_05775 [Verrucomicrobiota bacterium]|nr:hypothetical protein [Verrucomicrobiota bacterium]
MKNSKDNSSKLRQELLNLISCKLSKETPNVSFSKPNYDIEEKVAEAIKLWPHLNNLRVADSAEYKIQDVLIDNEISGRLRIPEKHNGMAVLCLHGHARGMMLGKEMTEYCTVPLAQQNFITLSVDLIGFGNRRNRDFDDIEIKIGGQTLFQQEKINFARLLTQGKTLVGNQIEELSTCVSFLKSLDGIKNVAVMGHSMGGIFAFWLGALDQRIDCTICLAGMINYEAFANSDNSRYHDCYCLVPGIAELVDSGDILSLIAPRGFYGIHGRHDRGFPIDRVIANSNKTREVYKQMGAEKMFRSEIIDCDHGDMLSEKYLCEIFNFLKIFR